MLQSHREDLSEADLEDMISWNQNQIDTADDLSTAAIEKMNIKETLYSRILYSSHFRM